MSIKDLSQQDFSYLRKKIGAMQEKHDTLFKREIQPELMSALYRGYKTNEYRNLDKKDTESLKKHILCYSRIFTACNTIIPNLHYQMPRVLAIPEDGTDPTDAATMTAYLNRFNKISKQKQENQNAVIHSYFMGIAWKKVGFNAGNEPTPKRGQEAMISGSKIANVLQPGPFNTFESPLNVQIDDKGTWRNFRAINHHVERSLADLYECGFYEQETLQKIVDQYEKKNGSKYDDREVMFRLNELMLEGRDGVYMMVSVEEFNEPLYFDRLDVESVSEVWHPLVLTNEPDGMYPPSHVGVASRVQTWIDEVASKYVEMIGRSRRGHYINQDIMAPGQTKESFLKNLIGGVMWGKRPISQGDIAEINSSPIQADFGSILQVLQQNVSEIMGSDSQRLTGQSQNETLGQDKIAALGTEIREGGMLDRVRDWLVAQTYAVGNIAQKNETGSFSMTVEPRDFADHENQDKYEESKIDFRTPNQQIPMNYMMQNSKFKYEINVYEAVKPDKKALAKEYDDFMLLYSNPVVQQALLKNSVLPRLDLVSEERAGLFEYMDGKRFLQKLDSMQQAAIQTQQMIQQGGVPNPAPAQAPKQEASVAA